MVQTKNRVLDNPNSRAIFQPVTALQPPASYRLLLLSFGEILPLLSTVTSLVSCPTNLKRMWLTFNSSGFLVTIFQYAANSSLEPSTLAIHSIAERFLGQILEMIIGAITRLTLGSLSSLHASFEAPTVLAGGWDGTGIASWDVLNNGRGGGSTHAGGMLKLIGIVAGTVWMGSTIWGLAEGGKRDARGLLTYICC